MAVITISRYFGAGGITLGRRLSHELGYRFVNDKLIAELAEKINISSEQILSIEKRGTSRLEKLLDFIVSPSFLERHSDKYGYLTEQKYVAEVREITLKLYEQGNAVIIGRGGNYTLQDYPGTVHVLLVADMEHRVRFLMKHYDMTEPQAEQAIERADMIRQRFLDCFAHQHNHDDPRLYTITLNMNHLTMDKAVELVKALVS
ncbi:MAG: AAA family ATPase [Desulfobacteraceae bacterium]